MTEVITVLVDIGIPHQEATDLVVALVNEIIDFDQLQAYEAARLRKDTKTYGLSLGDRACLALAKIQNIPVLTADKAWSKLDDSTKIQVIC